MKITCTKCGSEEVYFVEEETQKDESDLQTMDEYIKNIHKPVPLIYRLTVLRCKKCGYEVRG